MFYIKFLKYLVLGLCLVNLNQVYSMKLHEFEEMEINPEEKELDNFKVVIENNTGYPLLLKVDYSIPSEHKVSAQGHNYLLPVDAQVTLSFAEKFFGYKAFIKYIKFSYEKSMFPHELVISYQKILHVLDALDEHKNDIKISLTSTYFGNINGKFEKFEPLHFINIESVDIVNNSDLPIIISKKGVDIDGNLATKAEELILIGPAKEKLVKVSKQEGNKKSLTTEIEVAFAPGFTDLLAWAGNLEDFIKKYGNNLKEFTWVKFLDDNMLKNYEDITADMGDPVLVVGSRTVRFHRQPSVKIGYKNKETGKITLLLIKQ